MKTFSRLTAVAALLAAGPVFAQESVGTVVGLVKDPSGHAIPGVTVIINGAKILGQRTITSNERGEYRLPLLPPGDYVMQVRKDGWVGSKAEFRLYAGQTLRQEFSMRAVQVAQTEVEVVATAAAVDKTETKSSTNFTLETLQSLPTGSLNSYGALAVAPGVVGSTSYPSIRGSVAGQSNFMVNGISARDAVVRQGRQFELILDDLTEDIAVVQSPVNARYGNTSGGLVNLVTKQGTNEFSGSLRVKLDRDSWAAKYPRRYRRDNSIYTNGSTVSPDSLARTYEIAFSGPIIKDHLTFTYGTKLSPEERDSFSLYNVVNAGRTGFPLAGVQANTFGVDPLNPESIVVSGNTKSTFHTYKLFWAIGQNHSLEFFQTINKYGPSFDTTNNPGTTVDPNADFYQTSDRDFYGFNYRGVIGGRGLLDVRYGNRESNVKFSSGPGVPINVRVWIPGAHTSPTYGGNAFFGAIANGYTDNRAWLEGTTGSVQLEERASRTFSANFNWFTDSHNIDAGFEHVQERAFLPEAWGPRNTLYYSPGMSADGRFLAYNFFGSLAQTNTALRNYMLGQLATINERREVTSTGDSEAKARFTTNSLYANDLWTLNANFSFMGGLRYDQWKVEDRTGERVKSGALSPRFLAKWDIRGDNAHLMSLSYAWFRSTLSYGSMGGAIRVPGNIIQRSFWNNGSTSVPFLVSKTDIYNDANYTPYTYQDSDVDREINPDLRPDKSTEITLGYARAFSNGGSFKATAVYRKTTDMLYLRGVNAVVNLPNPMQGVTYATVPTTYQRVLDFDPYGDRTHYGLELEWNYPVYRSKSQSLVFAGNWTINRDYGRDTFRDGNVGDSAARWDAEFAAYGIPMDVYNPHGELGQSIHNIAKAWLTWDITSANGTRNSLSLMASYSSGTPYSMGNTYAVPAGVGLPVTSQAIPGFTGYYNGRGRFATPQTFSADLQWNLTIPIVSSVAFTSYLSVFNIFNHQIPTGMDRPGRSGSLTYTPATYGYLGSTDLRSWGVPGGLMGARGINLDLGIRF